MARSETRKKKMCTIAPSGKTILSAGFEAALLSFPTAVAEVRTGTTRTTISFGSVPNVLDRPPPAG